MKDEDLKRSIEEALAVGPEPQFTARVHRRIEAEREKRRVRIRWAQLAAGLGTAAVLISFVTLLPQNEMPAKPTVVTLHSEAPSPRKEAFVPQVEAPAPPAARLRVRSEVRPAEPEILIDPREGAALRRFVEDVQERKIDPSTLELFVQAVGRVQTIKEIIPVPIAAIEPIDVPPLDPWVSDNEGGSL